MKAISNLAVTVSAIILVALLLVAQYDYHRSFETANGTQVSTSDVNSIAAQTVTAETVALN